jgi:intracellular sulfur oxidation DsrE/DsrF family protein
MDVAGVEVCVCGRSFILLQIPLVTLYSWQFVFFLGSSIFYLCRKACYNHLWFNVII